MPTYQHRPPSYSGGRARVGLQLVFLYGLQRSSTNTFNKVSALVFMNCQQKSTEARKSSTFLMSEIFLLLLFHTQLKSKVNRGKKLNVSDVRID
ncbi:hypothetical protein MHYP_G00251900 [Metynnis hypsauchen]